MDNFLVLAIEGILNMLHSSSCQELPALHELAASSDAFVVENVPAEVQKPWLVGGPSPVGGGQCGGGEFC
jgi:hypothetical protein